jgi:hypothetical protein
MKFLTRWLGLDTPPPRAGLRPHRVVELAQSYEAAYSHCLRALDFTLGANITIDDRKTGLIEAGFGLINSERIRCSLERIDDTHTRVQIESFYPAGAVIPETSQYVEAMAVALTL